MSVFNNGATTVFNRTWHCDDDNVPACPVIARARNVVAAVNTFVTDATHTGLSTVGGPAV